MQLSRFLLHAYARIVSSDEEAEDAGSVGRDANEGSADEEVVS